MSDSFQIRPAEEKDCASIAQLAQALAEYEGLRSRFDEAACRAALFGTNTPCRAWVSEQLSLEDTPRSPQGEPRSEGERSGGGTPLINKIPRSPQGEPSGVVSGSVGGHLPSYQNRINAMLIAYPGYDVATASHGMHLADIYVRDEARGQGIGTALMAALAEYNLDNGGEWVSWTVLRANEKAHQFYHRLRGQDVAVHFMAAGKSILRQWVAGAR